jgi:ligand-binding SRPBCC domain-containing protein
MTPDLRQGEIAFDRQGPDFVLTARQWLPTTPQRAWPFLADCRHMNHVIPPFIRFEIDGLEAEQTPPELAEGVTYDYRLKLHGIGVRWRTLVTEADRPHRFVDIQQRGPYARFSHEHRFERDEDGTGMIAFDRIVYRPPGGWLAPLVDRFYVRGSLRRLFEHRHRRLPELFADAADPSERFGMDNGSAMRSAPA